MNYLMLLVGAYMALANTRLGPLKFDLSEWNAFKLEYRKEYGHPNEESMRKMIFAYNKQQVESFNTNHSKEAGFELSLNHLADISELEMKQMNGFRLPERLTGEQLPQNSQYARKFLESILNDNSIEVPNEVDWRKVPGRVTPVKNQGPCGSCWAFASTGVLEGQEYRKSENASSFGADSLISLSEQNLVDCVPTNRGCNGGFMSNALDYVKAEGGIEDEKSYPYIYKLGDPDFPCRFNKSKVVFTDNGSAFLDPGDEQQLKEVVAKFGPVAVAIDASSKSFQFYHKGVYYNKDCKNRFGQLDHAVLVVGYGTDPKRGDYWIVKNSWGPGYGESGYIRMARNKNNNCGIASLATIPTF